MRIINGKHALESHTVSRVVLWMIPTTDHHVLVILYMETPSTGDDQSAMLSHAITSLESECCFIMSFVCNLSYVSLEN